MTHEYFTVLETANVCGRSSKVRFDNFTTSVISGPHTQMETRGVSTILLRNVDEHTHKGNRFVSVALTKKTLNNISIYSCTPFSQTLKSFYIFLGTCHLGSKCSP